MKRNRMKCHEDEVEYTLHILYIYIYQAVAEDERNR
jgi:hypothetical protein